ncbi:MAG: aldehyde dehydrogenase (NADP(+)) [Ginsengibacter sp.]
MFKDATISEIDAALIAAWNAFLSFREIPVMERANFMRSIANEMEALGDELIKTAMRETNLPEARLRNEKARTIFQLNNYAQACEEGTWLHVRIDTALKERTPPKPDLRKTMTALGPVVVFGASNFPFAYSTAGGDTACAFAAGCPVIVKAHPAHAETSELVASAIKKAVQKCRLPTGVFAHLHGAGSEVGKALVTHANTKAVGFTGSFAGGKALFDWANQRKEPIPVFAEMGSVNPVFLLPGKLSVAQGELAKMIATSVTLGVGQFCTNPGLIIGIESESLRNFIATLGNEIKNFSPALMLHTGIAKNYYEKRGVALSQQDVILAAESSNGMGDNYGSAAIATTSGDTFLKNPLLHQEVFGPYSLVIICTNSDEMIEVAKKLEGQLTVSVMATTVDLDQNSRLLQSIKNICGRMILDNVPTGVEVCLSMHHGGPFPATTDSRFTSVGADGIKRFVRPVCYQSWDNNFLPDELKNENPLGIWRTVNDQLTKEKIK